MAQKIPVTLLYFMRSGIQKLKDQGKLVRDEGGNLQINTPKPAVKAEESNESLMKRKTRPAQPVRASSGKRSGLLGSK
tara:strand:- start:309 stop:542 length:234 start_codon:yes stop_codon:yes gene_type:complete